MTLTAPAPPSRSDAPPATGPRDRRSLLAVSAASILLVGVGASFGVATAAAGLLAVVVALAVLRRPVVGALALVALVPALSGLRRGLPVPGLRLSETLVVGLGGLVVLAVADGTRPWTRFDLLTLGYAVLTLVLGAVNLWLRSDPFTAERVGVLVGPFQFFLLYRAVHVGLATPRSRRWALRLLVYASVPVSVIAIAQQLDLGPTRDVVASLAGDEIFRSWGYQSAPRATGLFPHWHPLAGYLVGILAVSVASLVDRDRPPVPRRAAAVVVVTASAALVVTLTITAIVGAAAVAVVLGVRTGRGRAVLVSLATVAVGSVLLFGPFLAGRAEEQLGTAGGDTTAVAVPQTISYRLEVWQEEYVPLVERYILIGYGPDLPASLRWQHTESVYLTLLLRGGLLLLGVYVALMVALFLAARDAERADESAPRVAGAALVALLPALAVMQLLFPYFTSGGLPHVLWILAALVVGRRS